MKCYWQRMFLRGVCLVVLFWGAQMILACQKKAPEQVGEGSMEAPMPVEKKMKNQGGGPVEGADSEVITRGEYLANTVMGCGDCHTPRDTSGEFKKDALFSGVANFVDLVPGDPEKGAISAPNLTPSVETGLGKWTAEQIKMSIVKGVDAGGEPLQPVMPYWLYGNLRDEDADAIVAYLQAIPAVENKLPPNQPTDKKLGAPAPALTMQNLPQITLDPGDSRYKEAHRGQYLVAIAACADCHTQETSNSIPIALDKIYAGGRSFPSASLGLMSPPFPMMIYSSNLTPDVNGLQDWTAEDIRAALKDGIDRDGQGICPPMPSGPHGAYAGLKDEDALAMGHYLLSIPAVNNGVIEGCAAPQE